MSRLYVNEPTIRDCGRGCLTYTTPEGEYDVASYDLYCPVHGWRWDWPEMPEEERPKTLAECEAVDRAKIEELMKR